MKKSQETYKIARRAILENPQSFLEDRDVMRALIAADTRRQGHNVVDLRSVAINRMEGHLDKLKDTHNAVIAAACDNALSMGNIHRAVLSIMDAPDLHALLGFINTDLHHILGLDLARLYLESHTVREKDAPAVLTDFSPDLSFLSEGYVGRYIMGPNRAVAHTITLRRVKSGFINLFQNLPIPIRSEAIIKLDLGDQYLPGMLVLGAQREDHFNPKQAYDLLVFLGRVFERALKRWIT